MLLIRNLRKSFTDPHGASFTVLDIGEFRLGAGEQMALVGASGSGKTTLLHVIAGISRADEGQVEIAGVDIARLPEAARDRFRAQYLGYVFQTFNLLPGFTALENVLLGMSFAGRGADRDRAARLLERVGLSHRLSHRPSMLSVGEQQRVAVARALVNRPKLVLADEPTANIDARHQQQVVDLLRQTCQEDNVALVVVTHTPEVAEQFERVDRLDQFNRALAAA